jgi:uncharacterized Zn finger protein
LPGKGYDYYKPSKPRATKGGIKATTKRGEIGSKWWSKKWISVLKSYGWDNRLPRGARYARSGQVIKIDIDKGEVDAYVQGSRSKPYHIKINFPLISEKQWVNIFRILNGHREIVGNLLNGNVPSEFEELLEENNLSLFLENARELDMSCTCPDYAIPCKHIAAVFYILAENFDSDPFLILLLRGKNKQEIISALSSNYGIDNSKENHEDSKPVENLYNFWSGKEIKPVKINIIKSNPLNRYPLPDEINDPEIIKILQGYYDNIKKMAEKIKDNREN